MSQSQVNLDMTIKVRLTLDDHAEPQSITVKGYGNIPRSGVRAIATEALESYFGSVNTGYRVQLTPDSEGEDETEGTVFEIRKSLTARTYR